MDSLVEMSIISVKDNFMLFPNSYTTKETFFTASQIFSKRKP